MVTYRVSVIFLEMVCAVSVSELNVIVGLILFVRSYLVQVHQYQVVGRALPTEAEEHPKIYRMKLWATNEVRAKSKFWYYYYFFLLLLSISGDVRVVSILRELLFGATFRSGKYVFTLDQPYLRLFFP